MEDVGQRKKAYTVPTDPMQRFVSNGRIHSIQDTITMRALLRKNRRALSWLLTVAMLLMAMGSGGFWQCRDGTPCPADCPMLHGKMRLASSPVSASQSSCSRCPSKTISQALQPAPWQTAFGSASRCIFTQSESPPLALQERAPLPASEVALPAAFSLTRSDVSNAPVSLPATESPPQRYLSPCGCRAPPSLS